MDDGFEESDWLCIADGCFELVVGCQRASDYNCLDSESEISFEFMDEEGGHFQGLHAPYSDHFCCAAGDVFEHPSALPTPVPSVTPVPSASPLPTALPTIIPSPLPTTPPSASPTSLPTPLPTMMPTPVPSSHPTTALCTWAPTYSITVCADLFGGTCYSSEVHENSVHTRHFTVPHALANPPRGCVLGLVQPWLGARTRRRRRYRFSCRCLW